MIEQQKPTEAKPFEVKELIAELSAETKRPVLEAAVKSFLQQYFSYDETVREQFRKEMANSYNHSGVHMPDLESARDGTATFGMLQVEDNSYYDRKECGVQFHFYIGSTEFFITNAGAKWIIASISAQN